MSRTASPRFILLGTVAVLLAVILYLPVTSFDWVAYDDFIYVHDNPMVSGGLTLVGVRQSFSSFHEGYWAPLLWLSFMTDAEMFGLNPGGFHLINMLLHAANVALLLLILVSITGALWRSIMAALLLAVHPIHVESVAWVVERKEVLSTFLMLAAVGAYIRHIRRPGFGSYLMMMFLFSLGLITRPTVATFPLLLLLLDFWPLGRISRSAPGRRRFIPYLDKLPLLALSGIAFLVTLRAQKAVGSLHSLDQLSMVSRIINSLAGYSSYLGKMVWPRGLSWGELNTGYVFPWWRAVLGAIILVSISVMVITYWRRRPYAVTGWCWYLSALLPAIGLFRVGASVVDDRFAYVPFIGLYLALAWGFGEITVVWPILKKPAMTLAAAVVIVLTFTARQQIWYWRDAATLNRRILEVNPDNFFALTSLGADLAKQGRIDEAMSYFRRVLDLNPCFPNALYNMGTALRDTGRKDEAIEYYERLMLVKPDDIEARFNLGLLLLEKKAYAEALAHFKHLVALKPETAQVHYFMGVALEGMGMKDEAAASYREELRISPDYIPARDRLLQLSHDGG